MRSIPCALALAMLLAPAIALADPSSDAGGKVKLAKPVAPKPLIGVQVPDPPPPAGSFNPRWNVPSVTISGLNVWTFKPGHFQGQ